MLEEANSEAKFCIGQVVKHRLFPFRGVVYDVDPEFANTEEWYEAIPPHIRPRKDQPFYHLLAENDDGYYEAYVSEQNLLVDDSGDPSTTLPSPTCLANSTRASTVTARRSPTSLALLSALTRCLALRWR